MRRSTEGPSTVVSPSSSIPSSAKNALAASRSSTTMRTLSIRSSLFFVIVIKLLYLLKTAQVQNDLQKTRRLPAVRCTLCWAVFCSFEIMILEKLFPKRLNRDGRRFYHHPIDTIFLPNKVKADSFPLETDCVIAHLIRLNFLGSSARVSYIYFP